MDNQQDTPKPQEQKTPGYRGLYRHVKISVKALDCIIAVCVAVIILVVALDLRDTGITISFNSNGGTDVPSQTQQFDEPLEVPEPPTREGYRFTGWYTDSICSNLWDVENRTVQQDMTLYAGWEKLE